MENPVEIALKAGMKNKAQLIPAEMRTVGKNPFVLIDGGTIMAINIAYKAMPKDNTTLFGNKFPAVAPNKVPNAQPKYGSNASP